MYDYNIKRINLTVLYEELDRKKIQLDVLKKAFGDEQSFITEFPDMLLVSIPEISGQVRYADNRLFVNLLANNNINDVAVMLGQAMNFLLKAGSEMKVNNFGYNLFGFIDGLKIDVNKHLIDVYYGGGQSISKILDTKLLAVAPKFSFDYHGARFNLALTPKDSNIESRQRLNYHCNIHFDGVNMPQSNDMELHILKYHELLIEIMGKIMEV